ncbi:MAG: sigma-70 family RNA polymerase sigma factor [Chloroflexota bacterium]
MDGDGSNDLALVVAAQAGDDDAFALLVTRHTPALLRLSARALGDTGAAEDVVQETFLHAYDALRMFRGEARLGTWLARIALRRCQERWSKERRRLEIAEVRRVELLWADPTYSVNPVAVAEAAERRVLLEAALSRLPAPLRLAVLLHDAEGLPIGEVAALTGAPLGTAKSRVRRGRAMLVTVLAEAGVTRAQQGEDVG